MQLIGMLDSPYVRRVAISAHLMGFAFEHRSVSVLRHVDLFRTINPLLKVPTLICDDGEMLVDSSLILQWLESQRPAAQRLWPQDERALREALRLTGIALVACEKTVQHLYETQLRPETAQYAPWIARVKTQLDDAWAMLEESAAQAAPWLAGNTLSQADITLAVAWGFNQFAQPGLTAASRYPAIAAFAARAEVLPAFIAYPVDRT